MVARFPAEVTIDVSLDEASDPERWKPRVARSLGLAEADLPALALKKRSLDARGGKVRFHLSIEVGGPPDGPLGGAEPRAVGSPRVIIVGAGPCGLFCAYELARRGVGSIVVDRGKLVQPRRRDLKGLNRHGVVDPDSNYCFGEGGAGTYSDGKLYTRAHKRGSVRDVIEILAQHGAPPSILTEARPHIGSNRLPDVVSSIRERLEAAGVVFRFGARVTGLLRDASGRAAGVTLASGEELRAGSVVVATGHSASDVVILLKDSGVRLEAKSFALGVRIEHPQPLINGIQYGASAGHPALPAAAYRVAETVNERGVFSFCMCPGGFIVPASTVPGGLVVNGMSLSRRDSPYANSGLVVAVEPADVERAGFPGPLGGVELQRRIEAAAFEAGGGMLRAPAVRATDFVAGRTSQGLPGTSYIPGIVPADVGAVLDSSGVAFADRIRVALRAFDRRLRGYLTEEAVLVGVESRTSSPVRVPRDATTLESPDIEGLYPAGEGAGYAGGIMSAAMDGARIGESIAARIGATQQPG
jgi:uncharacterized FAD-dependent dehydrogenase